MLGVSVAGGVGHGDVVDGLRVVFEGVRFGDEASLSSTSVGGGHAGGLGGSREFIKVEAFFVVGN